MTVNAGGPGLPFLSVWVSCYVSYVAARWLIHAALGVGRWVAGRRWRLTGGDSGCES